MNDIKCAISTFRLTDITPTNKLDTFNAYSLLLKMLDAYLKTGVNSFVTTLEPGMSTWCVDVLDHMRIFYPNVHITALLLSKTLPVGWSASIRKEARIALAKCDRVLYTDDVYTNETPFKRNIWLADNCKDILLMQKNHMTTVMAHLLNYSVQMNRNVVCLDAVGPHFVSLD